MSETFTNKICKAFERAISQYSMFDGVHGILVGYSGGADSSAMLHLLNDYCKTRGIYLHALHVNHGIRGYEAKRDADFCCEQCKKLGVEVTLVCADIPALAKESGMGIEQTARNFRYEAFLKQIESDSRIDCVATAHNADDNAETVLFNLSRGSGIDGLCGIPPTRRLGSAKLIRPLILAPKCDIVGYCRENGIEYIFDSTNDDTAYTRNYIRHELIPRFEKLNPSLSDAISRMTSNLREDGAYIDALASDFLNQHVHDGAVDTAVLNGAPRPIASRAVTAMYVRFAGNSLLECVHIDAILELVKNAREGSRVSLPGGVSAMICTSRLCFKNESELEPRTFLYELHEGINRFDDPDFAILIAHEDDYCADFEKYKEYLKNIYKLSIHTKVNSDKIKDVLYVRSRREGDAYVYGGMTRKLKKLYNDRGLSHTVRRDLPIVCDGEGIVWVPGFKAADRTVNKSDADLNIIYYDN